MEPDSLPTRTKMALGDPAEERERGLKELRESAMDLLDTGKLSDNISVSYGPTGVAFVDIRIYSPDDLEGQRSFREVIDKLPRT